MSFDSELPYREWPVAPGSRSNGLRSADPPVEQPSDGWLDEALLAVAVPVGLVERMLELALPGPDERQWSGDAS